MVKKISDEPLSFALCNPLLISVIHERDGEIAKHNMNNY